MQKGNETEGRKKSLQGLNLMQESLNYYHFAIQKDTYSIWTTYAQKDIERFEKLLDQEKKNWENRSNDSDIIKQIERLMKKLSEIQRLKV